MKAVGNKHGVHCLRDSCFEGSGLVSLLSGGEGGSKRGVYCLRDRQYHACMLLGTTYRKRFFHAVASGHRFVPDLSLY